MIDDGEKELDSKSEKKKQRPADKCIVKNEM